MLKLYAHPFSSYCWKALIALWERGVPFDYRSLDDPANGAELARLSPSGKMPVLVDGERIVSEVSIIIEYLDLNHPGAARMIPADPNAALDVRWLDRLSDNYLMTPMQAIVADAMTKPEEQSAGAVAHARATLDRAYIWWDGHMAGREWAAADFGLADCAAAPALFYADWVHPIPEAFGALRAYRARLLARPSVKRAVDEARPYRSYFPPGAPDRD